MDMLADVLKDFRTDGRKHHKIAADLVEIADRAGIHPRDVSNHKDLLRSKKLKPTDITPDVLSAAGVIERMDWQQTLLQVERINAIGKIKPKASPLVRALHRLLTTHHQPISSKGVFKVRKELDNIGLDMDDITDALIEKVQTYQNQLVGISQ